MHPSDESPLRFHLFSRRNHLPLKTSRTSDELMISAESSRPGAGGPTITHSREAYILSSCRELSLRLICLRVRLKTAGRTIISSGFACPNELYSSRQHNNCANQLTRLQTDYFESANVLTILNYFYSIWFSKLIQFSICNCNFRYGRNMKG